MSRTAELTPMLRHYLEVKARHPDALLFYRMGDFFELFFEDAERAAPLLEVALTARNKGTENEAPMCGVPHHAVDGYVAKLLRAGLKVAICDQVEDPAKAKGLVKREVTRVVTPGTVSEPSLLDGKEENLLASLVWRDGEGAAAFLDISTGRLFARRWPGSEQALADLALFAPREVIYPQGALPAEVRTWLEREVSCRTEDDGGAFFDPRHANDALMRQLGVASLRAFSLEPGEPAVEAAAAALAYARETQRSELPHVRQLELRRSVDGVELDATTLTNLEVFRNLRDGGRAATLVAVLDRTVSPPGGRALRDWLRRPLRDPDAIEERLEAVEELVDDTARRRRLREALAAVGDPERLVSRAVLGRLTPREAAALRDALAVVPELLGALASSGSRLLTGLAAVGDEGELSERLHSSLAPDPPISLKDGGVIAGGVDEELDRVRSLALDSKEHLLALEASEREATGISSLRVRYNKVFGYYIEVTKSNQHLVPERYIRKQTLANAERYFTPELKELEEQILSAEERQLALEAEHFRALEAAIAERHAGLLELARTLAATDVLATFAEVAVRNDYRRPRLERPGGDLVIEEGRHPVVERLTGEPFVPNDTRLGAEAQIAILTGPNMGGKSTYLRQVALIVLMAQAGSFVPAASASVAAVDRIFTRVGASDDLARGESTFMVEMIETARILHAAGPHSLVVLDEVGRGTATFDGLSLAWAIVEHLHEHNGARTLFATHYHELTELAALLPRVQNLKMAVKEWQDRIVFLRRVLPGSADKSYGLHVARLAGIPPSVTERAGEILANLEGQEYDLAGRPRLAAGSVPESAAEDQLTLFAPPEEVVASVLRDVDLEQLSPLAAMNLLHSLKARLK